MPRKKLALEYIQKHNLQLATKIWKVQESAWGKKDRKNFTEMLDYVKNHKDVKHIVFDVVDRMTRNEKDKLRIYRLIHEKGITVHFTRTGQMLNAKN